MGAKRRTGKISSLRVIAGRWKGRRIPLRADGIRPTADRVRETLFNWLSPDVQGTRCLDMFAGSGALGIEALSRGASSVVFVEKNTGAAAQISDLLTEFSCNSAEVLNTDAMRMNIQAYGLFDLVFVDPPFDDPHLPSLCTLLEDSGGLADQAHIYLEMRKTNDLPELPSGWTIVRDNTAGQVRYILAKRSAIHSAKRE